MAEQKHAIVTGGASGIGLGIARACVSAGYRVTIIGRNVQRLQEAIATLGPTATYQRADIAKRSDVETALAGVGCVDLLVNAAGFIRPVSLDSALDQAEVEWDAVIETNLKGSFLMAHSVARRLPRPGGRIVNISSIGAQTGGSRPGGLAYAAAKAGLHGLTFALARELAPHGCTANAIAPGFIAGTGFTGSWPEERVAAIVAETPVGRPGTPDDVAAAVLWLASEAASFVTGAVISVNGGWRIG
ncbi:3-oxoacyl-ACP reductase [Burkholderia sp. MSh2]|uniref:Short-chain dehydrogenase/reductase SDR n=1 Tax=Burkholderia paludis TaxID=1506587 RepID=A0A6J5E312_9BURK|nr:MULTISPECIES: SDR family NAD(P)-dependent oxidoreductase [Burkholderia]KEZ01668.1 3-oxoacyl-ACP reductase [Burkholderia sp. MSh2]KFG97841.1 3-oxoacyl-ACP reductase [Burkholderia paludis]CAB3759801.1 3-oxoacyl-[acyl-carrier-protein] reductase FabG [Burkholderia paludis]VWC44011.1 short-chain dehydrogenase/reductase SDR [Burkholderia paludis]